MIRPNQGPFTPSARPAPPQPAHPASVIGQYLYDALGRRVTKVATFFMPAVPPIVVTTLYFYDGPRIIEEQSPVPGGNATYVYGNHIDEILNMNRAGLGHGQHHLHRRISIGGHCLELLHSSLLARVC